jgi:hypothetical protein
MEMIPPKTSASDIRDESNRRAAKAGYCSKNGEPLRRTKIMVTGGFGESKLNVWPRDPVTGELL